MDLSRYQNNFFQVTGDDSQEYADYVAKTAKMVGKPFIVMHKIFEKEQWPLEKIKRRYHQVDKREGVIPKAALWFWLRKQDKV